MSNGSYMNFCGFYKNVLVSLLSRQSLRGTFLQLLKFGQRGVFANFFFPSLLHTAGHGHWRHAEAPMPPCRASLVVKTTEDAHLLPSHLLSPFPSLPSSVPSGKPEIEPKTSAAAVELSVESPPIEASPERADAAICSASSPSSSPSK